MQSGKLIRTKKRRNSTKSRSKPKRQNTFSSSEFSLLEDRKNLLSICELFKNEALRKGPAAAKTKTGTTSRRLKTSASQQQQHQPPLHPNVIKRKKTSPPKRQYQKRDDKEESYERVPSSKNSLGSDLLFPMPEDESPSPRGPQSSPLHNSMLATKMNPPSPSVLPVSNYHTNSLYQIEAVSRAHNQPTGSTPSNQLYNLSLSIKRDYQRRTEAAITIQKVFRGYLTRRILEKYLEDQQKHLQAYLEGGGEKRNNNKNAINFDHSMRENHRFVSRIVEDKSHFEASNIEYNLSEDEIKGYEKDFQSLGSDQSDSLEDHEVNDKNNDPQFDSIEPHVAESYNPIIGGKIQADSKQWESNNHDRGILKDQLQVPAHTNRQQSSIQSHPLKHSEYSSRYDQYRRTSPHYPSPTASSSSSESSLPRHPLYRHHNPIYMSHEEQQKIRKGFVQVGYSLDSIQQLAKDQTNGDELGMRSDRSSDSHRYPTIATNSAPSIDVDEFKLQQKGQPKRKPIQSVEIGFSPAVNGSSMEVSKLVSNSVGTYDLLTNIQRMTSSSNGNSNHRILNQSQSNSSALINQNHYSSVIFETNDQYAEESRKNSLRGDKKGVKVDDVESGDIKKDLIGQLIVRDSNSSNIKSIIRPVIDQQLIQKCVPKQQKQACQPQIQKRQATESPKIEPQQSAALHNLLETIKNKEIHKWSQLIQLVKGQMDKLGKTPSNGGQSERTPNDMHSFQDQLCSQNESQTSSKIGLFKGQEGDISSLKEFMNKIVYMSDKGRNTTETNQVGGIDRKLLMSDFTDGRIQQSQKSKRYSSEIHHNQPSQQLFSEQNQFQKTQPLVSTHDHHKNVQVGAGKSKSSSLPTGTMSNTNQHLGQSPIHLYHHYYHHHQRPEQLGVNVVNTNDASHTVRGFLHEKGRKLFNEDHHGMQGSHHHHMDVNTNYSSARNPLEVLATIGGLTERANSSLASPHINNITDSAQPSPQIYQSEHRWNIKDSWDLIPSHRQPLGLVSQKQNSFSSAPAKSAYLSQLASRPLYDSGVEEMFRLREELLQKRQCQELISLNNKLSRKQLSQEQLISSLDYLKQKFLAEKLSIDKTKNDINRGYQAALALIKDTAHDAKKLGLRIPVSKSSDSLRGKASFGLRGIIVDEIDARSPSYQNAGTVGGNKPKQIDKLTVTTLSRLQVQIDPKLSEKVQELKTPKNNKKMNQIAEAVKFALRDKSKQSMSPNSSQSSDVEFTQEELARFKCPQPYDFQFAALRRGLSLGEDWEAKEREGKSSEEEEDDSVDLDTEIKRLKKSYNSYLSASSKKDSDKRLIYKEVYQIESPQPSIRSIQVNSSEAYYQPKSSILPEQVERLGVISTNMVESVVIQAVIQLMQKPTFLQKLVHKARLARPSSVTDEQRLHFLGLLRKEIDHDEEVLSRMNQKICPLPSELLKCMRIDLDEGEDIDEGSESRLEYEEIGRYEYIISQQILVSALNAFRPFIQQRDGHIVNQMSKLQAMFSELSVDQKLKQFLLQREAFVKNRLKHTKDLRWQVLNIEAHSITQAYNEILARYRGRRGGYSGIGLNELTLSLIDYNKPLALADTKKLLDHVEQELQVLIVSHQDKLGQMDSIVEIAVDDDAQWINYSEEALNHALECVYLVEEELFWEVTREVTGLG